MGVRWIPLGLGVLLVGILVGYLMWGLPTRHITRQLNDLKTQLAEQQRRADELPIEARGNGG